MIELAGTPGLAPPPSYSSTEPFAFRAPRPLIAWMRERAAADGITPSAFVMALVRRERDYPELPADCRAWLEIQAAAAGYPHEPERALVAVIRELADRHPLGVRPPR